jgi:hypothetical protein
VRTVRNHFWGSDLFQDPECLHKLGYVSLVREEQITHYDEGASLYPRQKAGLGLKSHIPKVMKYEVRDYYVELFSGCEPEHVALLEINSV